MCFFSCFMICIYTDWDCMWMFYSIQIIIFPSWLNIHLITCSFSCCKQVLLADFSCPVHLCLTSPGVRSLYIYVIRKLIALCHHPAIAG